MNWQMPTKKIKQLSDNYNLDFIEDAACALGAREDSIPLATGIASSFSFHPRKAITSGEGGAIATNDDLLARVESIKVSWHTI